MPRIIVQYVPNEDLVIISADAPLVGGKDDSRCTQTRKAVLDVKGVICCSIHDKGYSFYVEKGHAFDWKKLLPPILEILLEKVAQECSLAPGKITVTEERPSETDEHDSPFWTFPSLSPNTGNMHLYPSSIIAILIALAALLVALLR